MAGWQVNFNNFVFNEKIANLQLHNFGPLAILIYNK